MTRIAFATSRILFVGLAIGLALVAAVSFAVLSVADDNETGRFQSFIENQISSPDMQIRLGEIDGALSSDVTFSEITIADRNGIWLRIVKPHLVWSRLALLRKKLSIDSLTAERIEISRKPDMASATAAADAADVPDDSEFALPDLPVAIEIGDLEVKRIDLGEPVAGIAATLRVKGSMSLAGGSLSSDVAITRLDQPADMAIKAGYDKPSDTLDIDVRVAEAKNGLLSNLMNIRGRPALLFTAKGAGPVGDFTADIGLSSDNDKIVAGTVALSRPDGGWRVIANVNGRLQRLVPETYADLFDAGSALFVDMTKKADGTSRFSAKVASGVLNLTADGSLAKDGFPDRIVADGSLKAADGHPVALPGGGGQTTLGGATFKVRLGDENDRWSLVLDVDDLSAPAATMDHFTLSGEGIGRDLGDPATRLFSFSIDGASEGLAARDPGIAKVLGAGLKLKAQGEWRGENPVEIRSSGIRIGTLEAGFLGTISKDALDGRYRLAAPDLTIFSDLAGKDLKGAVELNADGRIGYSAEEIALALDVATRDVDPGNEIAARLLTGRTTLQGRVSRSGESLAFDALSLSNPQLSLTANGGMKPEGSDLVLHGALADMSLVNEKVRGGVTLKGQVTGPLDQADISVAVLGNDLMLEDKPFRDATVTLSGKRDGDAFRGTLNLRGHLADRLVALTSGIGLDGKGATTISNLDADLAGAKLKGDLTLAANGIATGKLALDAPDLSTVAPLLLTEMAGALSADIALKERDADQAVTLKARADGLRQGTLRIGSATIDMDVGGLSGVPEIKGTADVRALTVGSLVVRTASVKASPDGEATRIVADADLARGRLSTEATLAQVEDGFAVGLKRLSLTGAGADIVLRKPASLTIAGSTVRFEPLDLSVGSGGHVRVAGTAGDTLDISADITALPLSVADAVMPSLAARGELSGKAQITGPAGDPKVRFTIRGEGVSAQPLADAGVSPLSVAAEGAYGGNRVTLQNASISGSDGLVVRASGTVPLAGGSMNVPVKGTIPLALARRVLDERGARLTGSLALDVTVSGPMARPLFTGSIGGTGIAFSDPESGLVMKDVALRIGLSGRRATLDIVRARLGKGTVTVDGSVEVDDGFTLPADLVVTLENARYSDGTLVTANASGRITVTGPLARAPVVGGKITLNRTEIIVPNSLPGGAAAVEVKHRDTPADVRKTLTLAGLDGPKANTNSGFGVTVDLTVEAPARFFIRGRGIDTELGGSIRLTGTDQDLVPVGSFKMVRGRIDVLGKRITFTTGEVSLVGDFDPYLNFVATSQRGNMTVKVTVQGVASDPKITFSSEPELPQDEVLAQLLFGQSVDDLSPFQIARLAAAAAELSGKGGSTGILGSIRQSTGLDDLDVVEDAEGNTSVKAGTYVSDNVYLGVQAGEESSVTINLDVTKDVKLKGQAGQRQSGVGIFYEREY